jgi:SAM-dependent methyltransferase
MAHTNGIEKYSNELYGENLSDEEIADWYRSEETGFTEIFKRIAPNRQYYHNHQVNLFHGFDHVPTNEMNVLSFGGFNGDELIPILNRIKSATILDPADVQINPLLKDKARVQKPDASGTLPFKDNEFDLITSFSVLNHIPKVRAVINEFYRCLKPNGYALLSEPVQSMGDWTAPRGPYCTKYERGIPIVVFHKYINDSGFRIIRERRIGFPLLDYYYDFYRYRKPYEDSAIMVKIDDLISNSYRWGTKYHVTTLAEKKLQPRGIYFVLQK